ncbi:MAG: alpha-ketoacid dehydrogenase subunit beta [Acidimicrobiia bacterium]|nr:alpha-ketoacid dehydrogenase subunit beta [bacterium]MXZ69496.1 alpha-ketoacid dehydrogenase subunit beta [Acidimicrobiia bacterium]
MRKMRMNQAVATALADEMRDNPDVVMFGEDIAVAEGPFKTSAGLLKEFGSSRVRDTPISEMGFLGAAVGAASTGLRPVVEIMFIEFIGVALDQLVTEAAKFHYLSRGTVSVPLTVRGSIGAGLGFGCQHSQTLESWMYSTPGVKLAVASGAHNAYGLLRAAIRDDNPVVFLEPRALYAKREPVQRGEEGIIPLGQAATVREGSDVTVVALGAMVPTALQAVEAASWSAEVIDLQTLVPYDKGALLESVAKTGRLVTVEENPLTGGWGGEITAFVAGELFADLEAPPVRITCPDIHVPYGKELEQRYLPGPDYVSAQIGALLDTGTRPPHWWESQEVMA